MIKWFPEKFLKEADRILGRNLEEVADKVEADAKVLCPVDSGDLKKSIKSYKSKYKDGGYIVWAGGGEEYYACVLTDTYVKKQDGFKPIEQIKIGDKVIAQDGLPHEVINKTLFPITKKPYLIEITTEYRKNRNHVLRVTTDHKILIQRNDVTFWAKAQDIEKGDFAFSPIKRDYKKGTAPLKICINCGKEYRNAEGKGSGKYYCCPKCRDEYWAKGHNPHIGMKRTEATRQKQSKQKKEYLKKHPEKHVNRILAQKGHRTKCEEEIAQWLKKVNIEFEEQYKVGDNYIDFAIPKYKILIEADGAFWHQDQCKDIDRDKKVMSLLPDWTLIHIHFVDRRFTKNIKKNPMNNVFYIQCNNSMNSFVNLKYFEPVKILKKSNINLNSLTSRQNKLCDLSIEGVHSFIASGIIVSNSFVEFGTVKMAAKPFLNPALDKNKSFMRRTFGAK